MIYLDHAAASFVETSILDDFHKYSKLYYANTNSLHNKGFEAYKLLEKSREGILKLLNLTNYNLIFNSGASEANTQAIISYGIKNSNRGKHLLYVAGDHLSVVNSVKYLAKYHGFSYDEVRLNSEGIIDVADFQAKLRRDTILFSFSLVNSELGNLQDIKKIKDIIKEYPFLKIHADATAAMGKVDVNYHDFDLISFSLHKLHGLKGSGILLYQKNINLESLIMGGAQEQGLRGGTSNLVLNILAYKTLALYFKKAKNHQLFDYLVSEIKKIDGIVINTNLNSCSKYILAISLNKLNSQIILNYLNAQDIYVSSHNTCCNRIKTKHSLEYITNDQKRIDSNIRISLSYHNTKEEIDQLVFHLKQIMENQNEL